MTSRPGKQTIPMHILTNVSRSKGNQGMKFGRLINYECGTFFSNNHTQNVLNKLFPDPFLENQNWAYLWINSLKCYAVCSLYPAEDYQNILKLSSRLFAFTFFKKKWGLELVCFIFCPIYKSIHFSCSILLPDQISLPGYLYFVRYWEICVLQLFANRVLTSLILKLNLCF